LRTAYLERKDKDRYWTLDGDCPQLWSTRFSKTSGFRG
jgi:hypothetical protein